MVLAATYQRCWRRRRRGPDREQVWRSSCRVLSRGSCPSDPRCIDKATMHRPPHLRKPLFCSEQRLFGKKHCATSGCSAYLASTAAHPVLSLPVTGPTKLSSSTGLGSSAARYLTIPSIESTRLSARPDEIEPICPCRHQRRQRTE